MLGILFVGGEAPTACEEIFYLIKKADYIIAADSGYENARKYLTKPNEQIEYLIGDMDSIDKEILKTFPKEKIINHPRKKDYSDTELSIKKLIDLKCEQIIIVGGGGGRVDHFLANIMIFENYKELERIYLSESRVVKVDKIFEAKNKIDSLISIFPLTHSQAKIKSSKGLVWELTDLTLSKDNISLSNYFAEENIKIEVAKGAVLIIEECSSLSEIK